VKVIVILPGFSEVGEEIQNRLCNAHILAAVVLREEGLPTNQRQSKDVSNILSSHAAQPLNHNESEINSAKPNKAGGMI
jgi:hypothetical protein